MKAAGFTRFGWVVPTVQVDRKSEENRRECSQPPARHDASQAAKATLTGLVFSQVKRCLAAKTKVGQAFQPDRVGVKSGWKA